MPRRKSKGPKISFTVNIGRGEESKEILIALKSKAKALHKTLPDFILSAAFHTCPSAVKQGSPPPRPEPSIPKSNPLPPPNARRIDYSDSEEPGPVRIDLDGLPSSKPLNS